MSIKIHGCNIYISYPLVVFLTLSIFFDNSKVILFSLICAILHESGHLFCMGLYGYSPHCINIGLFDVAIKDDEFEIRYSGNHLVILFAGSAANFIAATFFAIIYACSQNADAKLLCFTNIYLGVFNLLPVYGLDGGNILFEMISKWLTYDKTVTIVKCISFVILMALFTNGILILIDNKYNFTYLITSCYLFGLVFFKS